MGRRAFAFALLVAGLHVPAALRANDDIRYKVARGDTLIGLAQKYLARPLDYRLVQRKNGIANPRAIPVGTTISIPRSLLKYRQSNARLASLRGDVSLIGKPALSVGQLMSEGDILRTGPGSSASLALEDGSRISLPSNSQIKIIFVRRYLLDSSLDYDFEVGRGGARSRVAPMKSPNDRYRVRTPKAVSAVRGTDFQTRFDDAANRDFAEVDEGAIAVGLPKGGDIALPAGNGLAVRPDGSSVTEAMLPPPALEGAGRLQNNPQVRFALPALAGPVAGYRLIVAADAGFNDLVADLVSTAAAADAGALPDGNYFLRARAISTNGIEGSPVTYAFKRRLNSVRATAGAGNDGWAFKWDGEGSGVIRYHFQLHRGGIDKPPMVDEPGLDVKQVSLSDLEPGEYYWRVGSVQFAEGQSSANWTPFEKITVSED
jgi:hypothetical protein